MGRSWDPTDRCLSLLAVVAKADDMRVGAVGTRDGLVLEDACNTRQGAAGAPRPPGLATATALHSLGGGSLTTVTLTVDAACVGTRARGAVSAGPARPRSAHPLWPVPDLDSGQGHLGWPLA